LIAYFLLLRPVKKQALLAFKDIQARGALKTEMNRAQADSHALSPTQQALALKTKDG